MNGCKHASLRAYRELRALGRSDAVAFEAAVRVYRYYHPSTSVLVSHWIVADWIEERELAERVSARGTVH